MEIISNSDVITADQTRACLELLGSEYVNLPYRVVIYKDEAEVEYEWKTNQGSMYFVYSNRAEKYSGTILKPVACGTQMLIHS